MKLSSVNILHIYGSSVMGNLDKILNRRSTSKLTEPGPGREDWSQILQVACSVPDHGCLKPYRFVIIEGEQRDLLAQAFVQDGQTENGELERVKIEKISKKAFLSPSLIMIIFSPHLKSKIPLWEQRLTAGCTGYGVTLGAHMLGYGAIWKSYGKLGKSTKSLFDLSEHEEILGWVNVGTTSAERCRRKPVDIEQYSRWLS